MANFLLKVLFWGGGNAMVWLCHGLWVGLGFLCGDFCGGGLGLLVLSEEGECHCAA